MKYGLLEYRYNHFTHFARQWKTAGVYSINIGDYIQTLAVRRILLALGIDAKDILYLNRDALRSYTGEPVLLVMNACFEDASFPLPSAIKPLFIGFQTTDRRLVDNHWKLLKGHEPIGCRDVATQRLLLKAGIKAYTTGCLTLTFPRRQEAPHEAFPLLATGAGAGALPPQLRQHLPAPLGNSLQEFSQRMEVHAFPPGERDVRAAFSRAGTLLDLYRERASLVITPLLHAASPCLGMGIPVILARKDMDSRFTAIRKLVPVHTPCTFSAISWEPAVPAVDSIQEALLALTNRMLSGHPAPADEIAFLDEQFARPDRQPWRHPTMIPGPRRNQPFLLHPPDRTVSAAACQMQR